MKEFVIACLSILALSTYGADSFTLTERGEPVAQIVTGEEPPESVAFAAKELQSFVKQMSGAELPIVALAAPKTPAILLGPAARAALPPAELDGVTRDGYLITAADGRLCIVGIDDAGPQADIEALLASGNTHDVASWNFQRGTLYGVYRLLEELGMRWFMPGEFGQRAPHKATLTFAGTIKENPHFITRTVGYWSLGSARGYNMKAEKITIMPGERDAIGFTAVENRMWELRMRGETFRLPLNHNPARTQWFERFGAEHPEYFALLPDGTREVSARGHLCYTSEGVLRERIADIKAFGEGKDASERGIQTVHPFNRNWASEIALDRYFSVLPNDGFRPCTCPTCLAMVPPDVVLVNQRNSKLVWDFVAKCAEAVPDMHLECLAYGSYSIPYPGMKKLPSNVIVRFCTFSNPAQLYYKDSFQRYEKLLGEWSALTANNMAFWQHYLSANRDADSVGMPEHTPQMYARVIRTMAKHGNHVFCEQMADSIMFELYNRYLLLKLFYDPMLDEREIWSDFLTNFYGPAGTAIGAIYDDIGRRNVAKIMSRAGRIEYWTEYYPAEVLAGYHAQAAEALKTVAGTEYEKAVTVFDAYYLGLMDRGLEAFKATMGNALSVPNPEMTCGHAPADTITVDGRLDEAPWQSAKTLIMYDVDSGDPAALKTEVKSCYDDAFVYFGITAYDPEAKGLNRVTGEPGTVDGIEIFLDTLHSHEGYYQMTFDLSGKLDERHYVDRIEPARIDWRSKAKWAVVVNDDHFVMEIALPRTSLEAQGRDLTQDTWGMMVGRTVSKRETGQGRFSSTSARLRRRFHQPALFNNMVFGK